MTIVTILPILVALFSTPVFAKLTVVTTTTDLAAIAREVGGDRIAVKSLGRGDQDPHYLEPKPSYVVTLSRADLMIDVGLDLEVGWLPVLLTQSRNGKIQRGAAGHLDASQGLPLLEVPTGAIDRSMGDVHPHGNPHYWLDPRNALVIAAQIRERLSVLDPDNAAFYAANEARFNTHVNVKLSQWQPVIATFKGKKAIAYHKGFAYFAHWTGLHVADYIEPKPGIPPSAAHLLSLMSVMRSQAIPLILSEGFYNPKPAELLAKETGATLLVLPSSVGGAPGIETYTDLFDLLIQKIAEAL